MMRLFLSLIFALLPVFFLSAGDAGVLLSFSGRSPEAAAQIRSFSQNARTFLVSRKIRNVHFFPGSSAVMDLTEANVFQTLRRLSETLKATDQLYIFVCGGECKPDGSVSCRVGGEEFPVPKMKEVLDQIPAQQVLFLMCTGKRENGKALAGDRRTVIVFAPDNLNFCSAVTTASNGVTLEQFLHPFSGSICVKGPVAQKQMILRTDPEPLMPETSRQRQTKANSAGKHLNPERSRMLQDAIRAAALFPKYSAVCTERKITVRENPDLSGVVTVHETILIRTPEGGGAFALFQPKGGTIIQAQIFFPDGRASNDAGKLMKRPKSVRFGGMTKNCLILRGYELPIQAPKENRRFDVRMRLQVSYPVSNTVIELKPAPGKELLWKVYHHKHLKTKVSGQTPVLETGPLPPYAALPYDDKVENCIPHLIVIPKTSWAEVYRFIADVVQPSAVLDETALKKMKELTDPVKDKTGKIRALYDYLCSIPYLTNPVGIDAIRPQKPGDMIRHRFGDCKDKANAFVCMAEKLGIPAYRVLVNRSGFCDTEFPRFQFNHMIVFFPDLPGYPDGLWLDPTDGVMPFGELPPGDGGRTGFLLNGRDGEFRKIPHRTLSNVVCQRAELEVDPKTHSVSGTVQFSQGGLSGFTARKKLRQKSPEQLLYAFREELDQFLDGFDPVGKITIGNLKEQTKELKILCKVRGEKDLFHPAAILPPGNPEKYFLMHSRRYPVRIAGEPVRYVQELRLKGVHLPEMNWEDKAGGLAVRFVSHEDLRKIEIAFEDTVIQPTDYPKARSLIRELRKRMNRWAVLVAEQRRNAR